MCSRRHSRPSESRLQSHHFSRPLRLRRGSAEVRTSVPLRLCARLHNGTALSHTSASTSDFAEKSPPTGSYQRPESFGFLTSIKWNRGSSANPALSNSPNRSGDWYQVSTSSARQFRATHQGQFPLFSTLQPAFLAARAGAESSFPCRPSSSSNADSHRGSFSALASIRGRSSSRDRCPYSRASAFPATTADRPITPEDIESLSRLFPPSIYGGNSE